MKNENVIRGLNKLRTEYKPRIARINPILEPKPLKAHKTQRKARAVAR